MSLLYRPVKLSPSQFTPTGGYINGSVQKKPAKSCQHDWSLAPMSDGSSKTHTPEYICIKHSDPSASHTHGGRAAAKIVFDTNKIRGVVPPVHTYPRGKKQEGRGINSRLRVHSSLEETSTVPPNTPLPSLFSPYIPGPIHISKREGINSRLRVHSNHEETSTEPPKPPHDFVAQFTRQKLFNMNKSHGTNPRGNRSERVLR